MNQINKNLKFRQFKMETNKHFNLFDNWFLIIKKKFVLFESIQPFLFHFFMNY